MNPGLSVVICTRNRAALLHDCLASLGRQSVSSRDFEVIVVDNGSTDSTTETVREFEEKLVVRRIEETKTGLSFARNTGWKAAISEYVAFLDDDAEAGSDWVGAVIRACRTFSPAPDALAGSISLKWESPRPAWLSDVLLGPLGYLWWGDQPLLMRPEQKIVGANCCFKKSILEELGGFNENLGRKGTLLLSGEETELQERLVAGNKVIWYCPAMAVQHFVPSQRLQPKWFYRRYYWGGISDALMKQGKTGNGSSSAGDAGHPSMVAALKGKLKRLVFNAWCALGGGSKAEAVFGRVYFSYAVGWLAVKAGYRINDA